MVITLFDKLYWGFWSCVFVFLLIGFYDHRTTALEAQTFCTEVDGRDYDGCVEQRYNIIRATRRTQ